MLDKLGDIPQVLKKLVNPKALSQKVTGATKALDYESECIKELEHEVRRPQ